jgi:hypothetical protein
MDVRNIITTTGVDTATIVVSGEQHSELCISLLVSPTVWCDEHAPLQQLNASNTLP